MAHNMVPLVNSETFLFPKPTMDAIRTSIVSDGSLVTESELADTISEILSNSPLIVNAVAQAMSSGGSIHLGEGPPPDFIPGSKVGDVYIDQTNLNIYQMETGV